MALRTKNRSLMILGVPSAATSRYLLDDQFSSGTAPSTALWTETDTGTVMSVDATNSRLLVSGGDGTNYDPSIWSTHSFARAAVGAIAALVRTTGAGGDGPWVGMHPSSTAPTNPFTLGFGTGFTYPNYRGPSSTATLQDAKRIRSLDYEVVIIPRPSGGNWYFLSGGRFGTWPSATLVWSDDVPAPDPLYVGLAGKSGAWRVDHVRVSKASALSASFTTRYGLALAADTFTRANGSGGATEVGNLTWTGNAGTTITIASNRLHMANGSADAYGIVNVGSRGRVLQCDIVTPAAGTVWAGIVIRANTADPSLSLWLKVEKGGNWSVVEAGTGGGGVLAQGAVTILNSTTYNLKVVDYNTSVLCFLDGAALNSGTKIASTWQNDKFGAGVIRAPGADNGTDHDNFAVWPATVTLPTSLLTVPTVPTGGTLIASDTFTNTDATALATHNAAWTAHSGTWLINSNKVRISAAAQSGYATQDLLTVDHESTITIDLPADPLSNDWLCGPVCRWTDSSNRIIARFLWQSASPEIEVWQTVAGVASLIIHTNITDVLSASTTHIVKLAVKGAQVASYLDGELIGQGITTLLTGTRAGIGIDNPADGQPSFDTWEGRST